MRSRAMNRFRQRFLQRADRRGAFTALAAFSLVGMIGFAALSVDLGLIAYTKTRLQNAADAAALAAAQEISAAVEQTGASGGSAGDANAIVESAARQMAERVVELNGFYLDRNRDVEFGKRVYVKSTGRFQVQWGQTPFNAVKVTVRRDNVDMSAPDARMPMFFAKIFGIDSHGITASAAGFVEARDLVLVLDYTGSMNDDSTFAGMNALGRSAVEQNQLQIFSELGLNLPTLPDTPQFVTVSGRASGGPTVNVTFKGAAAQISSTSNITSVRLTFDNGSTRTQSFNSKNVTASGTTSYRYATRCDVTSGGRTVSIYNSTSTIKDALGLDDVSYPFPRGSWNEFIEFSLAYSQYSVAYGHEFLGGYNWKYGKLTFIQYLLEHRPSYQDTPRLWQTSHYPFHAMKNGASLFCEFLEDLEFGDHLGLVTYDETSRVETYLHEPIDGTLVDIRSTPITDDYQAIDTIQRHKQAGHYASYTGIGYGMLAATDLLKEKGRYGARPTILLMTDGNANRAPSDFKTPKDWDWNKLTDYDGDGWADYTTSDINKIYAFYEAREAIQLGYTIHTLSVGAGADQDLMQAIAFAGGGEYINVPGGSTIEAMEEDLRKAFTRIAANVPPAKLLIERAE